MTGKDPLHHAYDYIIAGAGASGLSLLWHMMADLPADKRILVIDKTFKPAADKIWSFWSTETPFLHDLCHFWNSLEIICGGDTISEKLERYVYYCIRSADFQARILQEAGRRANVTLIETEINGFKAGQSNGTVITRDGIFKADWIFQSVLQATSHHEAKVDTSLLQHFTGWEIETRDNRFDPDKATLMDLDTEQRDGLTFFYTLPFAANRALVEYTIFSESALESEQYESAISSYLRERYHLEPEDYALIRRESGVIPMEDRKVPGCYNPRTLNMGTVGGLTKPTTGYTFRRIQDHCKSIVEALVNHRDPLPYAGSAYRFRVYDILLLSLLKNENEISRKIFHVLFEKNSIERVLQFLGEETNPAQEIAIFSKMPYGPFLRSICRMRHRIFTGA